METSGRMIDSCLMRYVPVRKRCAITAIYKDEDGYWAYVGNGYHCVGYFAEHVIHEDTITLFRSMFKYIVEDK